MTAKPPATIFSRIIARELPASIVDESEESLAFEDVRPVAATHWLLIPKLEIARFSATPPSELALLGRLWVRGISLIAKQAQGKDYALVINNGVGALQTVFHLHWHLITGRDLQWQSWLPVQPAEILLRQEGVNISATKASAPESVLRVWVAEYEPASTASDAQHWAVLSRVMIAFIQQHGLTDSCRLLVDRASAELAPRLYRCYLLSGAALGWPPC